MVQRYGSRFWRRWRRNYVLGNLGNNNKFQPKKENPSTFTQRILTTTAAFDVALNYKINEGHLVPVRGKECSSQQNPFLLDKKKTYKEFAGMEMKDIYGEDALKEAFKLTAYMFESVYVWKLGRRKVWNANCLKRHKQAHFIHSCRRCKWWWTTGYYCDWCHLRRRGRDHPLRQQLRLCTIGWWKGNLQIHQGIWAVCGQRCQRTLISWLKGKPYYIVASNNAPLEVLPFSLKEKIDGIATP